VDPEPQVLEGTWDYGRAVVIRFSTKDAFERWYYSEEYQEILYHRLKGADCDTILVQGKD